MYGRPHHHAEEEANAALIVRAVNSHEGLLAACKEAERLLSSRWTPATAHLAAGVPELRAAIAKAEGTLTPPDPTSYPAAQAADRVERWSGVGPITDETFDALGAEQAEGGCDE
jgi:hypothetical protein